MLIAGGVGLQGRQNVVADILSALWAGDSVLHEDLALVVGVGHVNQVNGNGLGHDECTMGLCSLSGLILPSSFTT